MDFFQRQEIARRNTKLLEVYFVLAVIGIILTTYLAFAVFVGYLGLRHHAFQPTSEYGFLWNPKLFLGVSVGTLIVIIGGSVFKTSQLAGGGSAVAEMLGGRPISANTRDPDERKLLNVVEEMAIASGTPIPQVYVLPGEETINAFAAGHSTSDMVVCATHGCLKYLTRDELQGVVGHEFSHILNGDMKLNLRLMGLVFGILCIAMMGRILLDTRGSSSRDRNPLPLVGLALLAIGGLGVFFGKLIKSAVSRQREFLADASSVQFTRNPAGLSSALQKVGGMGSRIDDPNAEDASHFFFANGLRESFAGIFSTHPRLEDRIRALDPSWDGKFKSVDVQAATTRSRKDKRSRIARFARRNSKICSATGPLRRRFIPLPEPSALPLAQGS
jgi:Zn-dependent protease with chaperone function